MSEQGLSTALAGTSAAAQQHLSQREGKEPDSGAKAPRTVLSKLQTDPQNLSKKSGTASDMMTPGPPTPEASDASGPGAVPVSAFEASVQGADDFSKAALKGSHGSNLEATGVTFVGARGESHSAAHESWLNADCGRSSDSTSILQESPLL